MTTFLTVAAIISIVLTAYTSGLFILPFLIALSGVRISRCQRAIRLATFDARAMMVAGFALWSAPGAVFVLWGVTATLAASALALTVWLGFRVSVVATATDACVSRCLLFVIPWSRRCHRGPAYAFTDGWGDFEDPEALKLGFAEGEIELAWAGAEGSTRCQELVNAFNAEMSALSARSPGR